MKKIFLFLSLLLALPILAQDSGGLSEARELSERGIIVDQSSTMAPSPYSTSSSLAVQEAGMYRLSDALIRQEALGVAIKLKSIALPDAYFCRFYFLDTPEWWVCRAAEIAADYGIVTRANATFRPYDTITLAEGLWVVIKALDIHLSATSTSTISGTLPAWQKRLILTIQEQGITLDIRDDGGRGIALYDPRIGTSVSGFDMSHRLTRGQFFQIAVALLHHQEEQNPVAHCTTYSDGCNDCSLTSDGTVCTERACIWQGIPKCYTCENGYTLENNRCVLDSSSCKKIGEAVSNFSLPPEYQFSGVCCDGLTSVPPKEGWVGWSNICAHIGDNVCDARYESELNSSDCRTGFDSSICQSYYDGCNNCSKTSNGTVCTLRACSVSGPAYCTSYVSYVPKNQSEDTTFLSKVVKEMRSYASDLSCTSDDQCRWSMVWQRACGGPTAAIAYSTKNISQSLIDSKGKYITDAERYFNEYYGIFSDCMYIQPPQPMSCVSGLCQ